MSQAQPEVFRFDCIIKTFLTASVDDIFTPIQLFTSAAYILCHSQLIRPQPFDQLDYQMTYKHLSTVSDKV